MKRARRVAYLVCLLLVVSGVMLLILGLNNVLAVTFILVGISGVTGVAASKWNLASPSRPSSNIDGDEVINQLFGPRDEEKEI